MLCLRKLGTHSAGILQSHSLLRGIFISQVRALEDWVLLACSQGILLESIGFLFNGSNVFNNIYFGCMVFLHIILARAPFITKLPIFCIFLLLSI